MLQVALQALKYIFRQELRERLPGILRMLRELEAGSSGGGELMMTIAEQWEQQGIEKGIGQGKARALLRLAQARFGRLGPEVEARVRAAGPAQLER